MYNLSNFSKLHQVCSTDKKDLSIDGHCDKSYHNLESSVKCPRCENLGELIESGPIRSLYQCRDCGIFAKLTHKKKRPDGLRRSIAQGELTKALEILEGAGHLDQDAIAALNLYRGDTVGIPGNASQNNQKTTATNDRCGFVLFEN
ncbi:hypothetical protein [Microcystis aeruginosa]|uniref:hypothetical protein n=1 Tax=Microcystis aeruginosa TaxID=1126 RepID=UPI000CD9D85C|nr:hypothetical protein [Microcystis aeruginosa]